MQKKIIALAIAAAISAPAFADTSNVTVYGIADVSYDSIKNGTASALGAGATAAQIAAGTAGATSNRVSSNTSRLGFKGSEDLGDGLSAVWQIESVINMGDTTGTGTSIGTRNTFAGLSSASAGTVVLGRHDTPYKLSTRAYDLFGDGIADNRSIMGGSPAANTSTAPAAVLGGTAYTPASAAASFDGRQNQVLAYISPKLGGVATLAIGYVNLSPANNLATSNKQSAVSVAGMFDIGSGFGASLAYESHDVGTAVIVAPATTLAAGSKEHATKLGLSYTQDAFNVNFAYEKLADNFNAGANGLGHNSYYLSGKYSLTANDTIKAAYTKADSIAADATSTTGAKQFTLGYDHSLSKRTYVYALYTKLSNDANASYMLGNGTASVGGTSTLAGVGASPSALAFGMRHTF